MLWTSELGWITEIRNWILRTERLTKIHTADGDLKSQAILNERIKSSNFCIQGKNQKGSFDTEWLFLLDHLIPSRILHSTGFFNQINFSIRIFSLTPQAQHSSVHETYLILKTIPLTDLQYFSACLILRHNILPHAKICPIPRYLPLKCLASRHFAYWDICVYRCVVQILFLSLVLLKYRAQSKPHPISHPVPSQDQSE